MTSPTEQPATTKPIVMYQWRTKKLDKIRYGSVAFAAIVTRIETDNASTFRRENVVSHEEFPTRSKARTQAIHAAWRLITTHYKVQS